MTTPRPNRRIPLDPPEQAMIDDPPDPEPVGAKVPPAWTWLVGIGLGLAVMGIVAWVGWRLWG